ncbi:Clr5 domain-containing protein [Schizothecium vesticola]|uniref:Clr5 domain-containing protein n=1 Tax=Schizothecium vesticola TaxID=314040 RepID=A0AA40EX25_9PEZI|nr:Clr5 domain-containing protein [Schizothecium vesticola]
MRAAYGTFLSPASAQLLPSGRGGRVWTRTMLTQSSSDSGDEEMTETRAVLWEVIHLHRGSLPDTARADVNFLAAMVAVLGERSFALRSHTSAVTMTPEPPAVPYTTVPAIRKSKHDSYAKVDDWDAHRQTIARLYLDEEMTLKDVKAYMEDNHAFFATEKMYKMRLKKWSLSKSTNSSRPTPTHLRQRHGRAAPPSSSHPVSWPAITRYLTHHPTTLAYMDGAFDSSLWQYSPHARCYLGARAGYVGMHRVSSWTSDIWSAVDACRRQPTPGSAAEVVGVVNSQMDHLTVMIREQDASLFPQMLRACLWLWEWDAAVYRVVAGFVGDMCEVQLGGGIR